ncbi:MAG TPA: tetratricopeptide repeat protein [Microcoleaceae cyanobacterium]|jgi:tetratricopeptide (TPR) repeat protein
MVASKSLSQVGTHQRHLYRLWNGQGHSMLRDRYYQDALMCFNQAIALEPSQAESWYGRGEALANLGFYSEALSCCHTALEFEPNHSKTWILQGTMLFYLTRDPEALDSCNQALRLHPHHTETWIMRGAILQRLGQVDAAYASYEKALQLQRQPSLENTIRRPLRGIRQLVSWVATRSQTQAPGNLPKPGLTHHQGRRERPSNSWQTTMTYSAVLVSGLMLVQLIQTLQLGKNPFVQSQFHSHTTLWIQTEAACQASGRTWQSGICWDQPKRPLLITSMPADAHSK